MSTLELDIQATDYLVDEVCAVQCTLTRSGDASTGTAASTSLKFTQTEHVHNSPLSNVYRGTLTDDRGMCERVVCKLVQLTDAGGDPKTVRHEADIYTNYLSQAQGLCVPRFYGLFEGVVLEDDAACIILEDCGVALTNERLAADVLLRAKVYRALMTIHKLGVVHGDILFDNMLVDDFEHPTRVSVIGFEHARPHPECDFCTELHAYTIVDGYVACTELLDAVEALQLVTPSRFVHRGQFIPLDGFRTVEQLADVYNDGSPIEGWAREDFIARVTVSLDKHRAAWGDKEDYVTGKKVWVIEPLV